MRDFFAGLYKTAVIIFLAVLGVCYILSPLDLIPDFIPIVGWIDDLGVLGLLIKIITKRIAWRVIIIPCALGALLWLINDYLGWIVGAVAFLYGVWKSGQDME